MAIYDRAAEEEHQAKEEAPRTTAAESETSAVRRVSMTRVTAICTVCVRVSDSSGLRTNDGSRSFLCERACAVADCAENSTAQMCVGGWVGALGDWRWSSLFLKSRIRRAGRSKERNRDIILWFTQTKYEPQMLMTTVVKGKHFNLKQTGDAFKAIT